jgi:hypothetical protein
VSKYKVIYTTEFGYTKAFTCNAESDGEAAEIFEDWSQQFDEYLLIEEINEVD